jgi:hypothetical protein
MKEIKLRHPYKLEQLIKLIAKGINENGFTNANFCLYTREYEEVAAVDLICYMELNPTINVEDEEEYPVFVVEHALELFYDGQQFEDVLFNVLHQKSEASINDFLAGLNYFMEHDTFIDLSLLNY